MPSPVRRACAATLGDGSGVADGVGDGLGEGDGDGLGDGDGDAAGEGVVGDELPEQPLSAATRSATTRPDRRICGR
jgi:hypothetical protein